MFDRNKCRYRAQQRARYRVSTMATSLSDMKILPLALSLTLPRGRPGARHGSRPGARPEARPEARHEKLWLHRKIYFTSEKLSSPTDSIAGSVLLLS